MAIKTFTTGEVLTAADTNTYLANSGLVQVASGTLNAAATNFVGCFTPTYRNYRVVLDNVIPSASTDVYLRYLSGSTPNTTSSYFYAYRAINSAGTSLDQSGAGINAGFINCRFTGSGQSGSIVMDIFDPQISARTQLVNNSQNLGTSVYISSFGGISFDASTVFDGFQINTLGAPTLTGNVTIYGYRQA